MLLSQVKIPLLAEPPPTTAASLSTGLLQWLHVFINTFLGPLRYLHLPDQHAALPGNHKQLLPEAIVPHKHGVSNSSGHTYICMGKVCLQIEELEVVIPCVEYQCL